jgi:hypothetical protein
MIFFFWKSGTWLFFLKIFWVRVGCEYFLFYFWVMGGFLCHDTLLFWFNLQGGCEGLKIVIIIFTYIGESHWQNNRDKLLFWFSFWGACESSIFFFIRAICIGWTHGQNSNFLKKILGLVCKVVVEVQRSSIIFVYMGVPHVRKLEVLFCFSIYHPLSWIHCVLFMSFCSLFSYYFFFVLWRDKRVTCLV